jgi:hypothetical protein
MTAEELKKLEATLWQTADTLTSEFRPEIIGVFHSGTGPDLPEICRQQVQSS